jgi:hypothetical protein
MLRKGFLFLCVAAVLILGSCRTDAGGPPDPIAVDPAMPAVSDLPSFEGSFPTNKTAALNLVNEVLDQIQQIQSDFLPVDLDSFLDFPPVYSSARKVETEEYNELWDHQEIDGATVTGFAQGSVTYSYASEDSYSPGDSASINLRSKVAADIDVEEGYWTVTGKNSIDGTINVTGKINSIYPDFSGSISGTVSLDDSYALTISNGFYGVKAVVTQKVRGIKPISISWDSTEEEIFEALSNLFSEFAVTIKIYDNENVLQYEETVTNPFEYFDF